MKKVKIVLLVVLICFLFTGCNSFRLSSIDDLITPISPSGEDASILAAVDDYCKSGYSIKIPSSGEYTTSFICYDLNGDGVDEAIAFFEPNDNLGTVDMAVLCKEESGWTVVSNTTGEGTDVNSVDFSDVNNDGTDEIIVCWSVLSNSTTSNLCVYEQYSDNDEFKIELIADSITASEFVCVDINDDSTNEILVFSFGSTTESPKAELYSFSGNSKKLMGETKLDSTIISFANITCGETDEGMSVYADAVRSDGDSMVTEFLYWSNYYDSIVSPFYSYSTGRTSETSRNNMITCRDINGDDEIEIPVDKSMSGLPEQITAQNWLGYESTVLNHKMYSYACEKDGYLITLDDDTFSSAILSYDTDKRELSVDDEEGNLFKIMTVIKTSYNSKDYAEYTEIMSDSGFVYLASVNSDKITVEDLMNNIKSY